MARKILVIDDDKDNLMVMKYFLEMLGYIPILVDDPRKAMEEARKTKPDIIIMDILMPELDGYELCAMFRSTEEFKNIPILGISAFGEVSKSKALSNGFSDYMSKPIFLDHLKEVLLKWS